MQGRSVYLVVALKLPFLAVYSSGGSLLVLRSSSKPLSRVFFAVYGRACGLSGVVNVASKFQDLGDLRGSQRSSVAGPGSPAEGQQSAVA